MHSLIDYKTYDIEAFTMLEKKQIVLYFFQTLNRLEWVETDEHKLDFLLSPFLSSKYVHDENQLEVCKKVIFIFYTIRKKTGLPDQEILDSILYCFERSRGMFFESLDQEVYQYWIEKGVDLDGFSGM